MNTQITADTDDMTLIVTVDGKQVYSARGVVDFLNLSYVLLKAKLEQVHIEPGLQGHPLLVALVNAVSSSLHKSDELPPKGYPSLKVPRPGTCELQPSSSADGDRLASLEQECITALNRCGIEGEDYENWLRLMMFPWAPKSLSAPTSDWLNSLGINQ